MLVSFYIIKKVYASSIFKLIVSFVYFIIKVKYKVKCFNPSKIILIVVLMKNQALYKNCNIFIYHSDFGSCGQGEVPPRKPTAERTGHSAESVENAHWMDY